MTAFAWLIEAPGQRYLATREIGHNPHFYWTEVSGRATRFASPWQADGVMMAVRQLNPDLFAFAANLGEARPVEHAWLGEPQPFDIETATECPKCGLKADALLHRFCQYPMCPVRDALKARKEAPGATDKRWSGDDADTSARQPQIPGGNQDHD